MIRDDDSHWGGSEVSVEMTSTRTMNTMRRGSITSRIICIMKPFPQMGGIPAKSMDITCSVYQKVRGQHGPRTGQ